MAKNLDTRLARRSKERKLQAALIAVHAAISEDEFAHAVFRLLLTATPGAFASAMVRTVNSKGALWFDSLGRRIETDDAEVLYRDHPGHEYLMQHPGTKILPSTGVLPPEPELFETVFYRNYMVTLGWRHSVALVFWKGPAGDEMDCNFAIFRTARQGDFSKAELRLLEQLHAHLDKARRRLAKLTAERSAQHALEELLRKLPLPTVVLEWNLKPAYCNREVLARWLSGAKARVMKPDRKALCMPVEIARACEKLKREWEASLWRDPRAEKVRKRMVNHPADANMRAAVSIIPLHHAAIGKPSFLVEIDAASAEKSLSIRCQIQKAAAGLSRNEWHLAQLVCEGRSNKEIANELSKGLSTIKNELASVFRKLQVASRSALVALLLSGNQL
jgi:DNA-binding CsgD family transcriptional regulator